MKNLKTYVILGSLALGLFLLGSSVASLSNTEVTLRNDFGQKMDQRTAFYDKMWKIISQKSQVAVKNSQAFKDVVQSIMTNRKDSEQLYMKWVTETNPNANFNEVSGLFKDLSRTIESQRENFFQEEKGIQDVVRVHRNLLDKFPSGLILKTFMGRQYLVYKPITSDRTDNVIKSGKDNDVNVF